ncbi:hypothetical protein ACFV4G_34690 [Kitasatospora sp. NPDC059747]|uniref:hypothetical protein n=1 Tax=Kitasatospora sp. NPDC059747 TaxID=3346930 RepID=UPI00365A6293
MTVGHGVPGAAANLVTSVERAGASGRGHAIESEIVIVDDDGNEEPYDPAKH